LAWCRAAMGDDWLTARRDPVRHPPLTRNGNLAL
jgi:hypothetical protein